MNFANENYLSLKTLTTLADIKHQLLELLVDIGFVSANLKKRIPSGQDYVSSLTGVEVCRVSLSKVSLNECFTFVVQQKFGKASIIVGHTLRCFISKYR